MHAAALRGFTRNLEAIDGLPAPWTDDQVRVLDMGGQDVNGTVHRHILNLTHNVRLDVLDIEAGAGVTIVGDARNTDWWDGQPYDLVISTEMLEHLEDWQRAVEVASRILRPGGWFVGTCASTGRGAHGATGAPLPAEGEHYENVDPGELTSVFTPVDLFDASIRFESGWDAIEVQYQRDPAEPTTHDLYWRARKAS